MKCRGEQQLPTLKENDPINVSQCYHTRAACTRECDKGKEMGAKAANSQKKSKKQIQRAAKATRRSNKTGKYLYRFAESGRPQLNRNLPQITLLRPVLPHLPLGSPSVFARAPMANQREQKKRCDLRMDRAERSKPNAYNPMTSG
jgi:hypothetical protein